MGRPYARRQNYGIASQTTENETLPCLYKDRPDKPDF